MFHPLHRTRQCCNLRPRPSTPRAFCTFSICLFLKECFSVCFHSQFITELWHVLDHLSIVHAVVQDVEMNASSMSLPRSHKLVPIGWMCKREIVVCHSSTESDIISLDIGLKLDGLPALELWDLIVSVLENVSQHLSINYSFCQSDQYLRSSGGHM